MAEQINEINEQATEQAPTTPTPEEVLMQMKETMVPKEEAAKWQNKYNELFRSVANGQFSGEDKKGPTEEELKAKFVENVQELGNIDKIMSDRDQITKLLEFDDYLVAHGRNSCFLPQKSDISSDDINRANRMRSFLETAVSQESDALMSSWTADHLDEPVPSGGRSRMI